MMKNMLKKFFGNWKIKNIFSLKSCYKMPRLKKKFHELKIKNIIF